MTEVLYCLEHRRLSKWRSYHAAAAVSCWGTVSVNQPLETWMRRQRRLLDLITVQIDAQPAESQWTEQRVMERHWISLKPSLPSSPHSGFDEWKTFSMSLCWEEACRSLHSVSGDTKEDTVRQSCDVLGHNKDISVSQTCKLQWNGLWTYWASVWSYSIRTDEVCPSLPGEWRHLRPPQLLARASRTPEL